MGLIHGETGKWLMKATHSPSDAHQVFNNLSNIVCKCILK